MFDYNIGDTVQLLRTSMNDPSYGMVGIIIDISQNESEQAEMATVLWSDNKLEYLYKWEICLITTC